MIKTHTRIIHSAIFKQGSMKRKYLLLFLIGAGLIFHSCKKEEIIGRTEADVSVTAIQSSIVWNDPTDLNTQINSAFIFDYANINPDELETAKTINPDTTIVTASINFKEAYRDKYEDSNILNNTASINLENTNLWKASLLVR